MISRGETLLRIARGTVAERLGGPEFQLPEDPWLQIPTAAFVTLRRGDRLHGCIGTVDANRPLGATIANNAALAAFEDPRSRPLAAAELSSIRFEVSVLGPATPIAFADEADARSKLVPFVDGVILRMSGQRGVLLPQVWTSRPEPQMFLDALKEKAGLARGFWSNAIVLERFGVEKHCEPGYGAS